MPYKIFRPHLRPLLASLWVASLLAGTLLWASPFAQRISFTQPDGTVIEIWGEGDEFHAVFESLEGYSVVFDHARKGYCFARLSADGTDLLSTGALIHQGNPQALGLAKHLRISPESRRQKARARRQKWEKEMEIPQRWQALKDATRQEAELSAQGDIVYGPPSRTTLGTKVGLTLLIDFDDDPATVPQSEIGNYCNGDSYAGYGNNGSVKKYYLDNSNGLLTYSNVVTVYIRIPNSLHPKSYYNDTSQGCGAQARLLITDAVAIMKAMTNFNTDIAPAFNALTVDANNNLIAANVFYAGGNGGVWSYGLWPHSSSLSALEISPGGKRITRYQISNIGSSLSLSTFCHENGHMLCGFPDIYDYDYDSEGGAGRFCLMDYGTSGSNPCQICAYLKRAAGWATTIDLTSSSRSMGSLSASGSNFNRFYRFPKPGVATEYFILENRQKTGRDSGLPAAGIALWHIDELGDKDNQNLTNNTIHANYEVTLVQADNQWHFQRYINAGDANDLYYAANSSSQYNNQFTDNSFPNAHWWNGSNSGAQFRYFSASANTMTFVIGEGDPYLAFEAESGALTAPMASFSDDALASRGEYIASSLAGEGIATYSVSIPASNQFVIWCRVLVTNANENSFYVSADSGAEDIFDMAEGNLSSAWQWVRVNGEGGTGVPLTVNPRMFSFTQGAHTITFRGNEPNSKLDRLIVTSDSSFVPNDTPPLILTQPQSLTVIAGGNVTFRVTAQGQPSLTYRWMWNGIYVSSATNADYTIANLQTWQSANYSVVVANLFGSVTSQVAVLTVIPPPAGWVAFNDHFAGTGTHSNASAWNIFGASSGAPGNAGQLKDIVTGALLPVSLAITNMDAIGGTTAGAPAPGTPAYTTFNRFVDFGSGTLNHSIQIGSAATVAYLFSGLNPAKLYSFKATAARAGTPGSGSPDYYSNRWTRVELAGATSFTSAHTPGVLTSNQVPADLTGAQAAFNAGVNTNGEMAAWGDIVPSPSGTLTVYSTRYTNTVPNGSPGTASGYSYALAAMRLEEVSSNIPPYIILQPQSLTVTEGTPAAFSLVAAGAPAPYTYQWQKNDAPLASATNASFAIPATTTNDAGGYSVVVANSIGAVTSQVAILTVNPAPPGWMAFNDHGAGSGTHANATRWNVFGAASGGPGASGRLKNILNGTNLPVTLTIINSGASAASTQGSAASGTPAYNFFNGYIDFQGSNSPSVEVAGSDVVTYRFTGLNPYREYNFAGTAIRGDATYTNRWTLFELAGVTSWVNAHTANAYTNGLPASQVAINTGINSTASTGDIAVWQHLQPGSDGSFEVTSRQYTGPYPGGATANGSKGYGMTGIRLEELPADPVAILTQPAGQLALVGDTVSFQVAASGAPPLFYQWSFNGSNVLNATNSLLLLTNVQLAQSGEYCVVITNSVNAETSAIVSLTVIAPPVIITSPLSQSVVAGEPVSMSVTASGSPPLSFQWRRNGGDLHDTERISGATESNLVLSSALRIDAGDYTVLVSNPGASVLSSPPAQLSVAPFKFNPATVSPNGQLQLTWRGEPGLALELQASTNLVDWQTLVLITNTPGEMLYLDPAFTNHVQRFYRATAPTSP